MLSSPIFQKYPQGRRLINLSNLTNYEFSGEENAEFGFNFVSFLNRKYWARIHVTRVHMSEIVSRQMMIVFNCPSVSFQISFKCSQHWPLEEYSCNGSEMRETSVFGTIIG